MTKFVNPYRDSYAQRGHDDINERVDQVLVALVNASNIEKCYRVSVDAGLFMPSTDELFIRFDALDPKDWPNGIKENSCFMEFFISKNKVELFRCGHVWLNKEDAEGKYKYFAMKGIQQCHVDYGGKKFRKSSWKSDEALAKKIIAHWNAVMESVDRYTGGYPYHQGKN